MPYPKLIDRFTNADSRFDQFASKFAAFVKTLEFFKEQKCPLRGVEIIQSEDLHRVIATYRTLSVSLRLVFELSEAGAPSARVVGVLETPSFSTEKKILGTFTFNRQGFTDFEVNGDGDPIEVQYMAPEIVLQFLHLALQHGVA